jgi:xylan 1,4-beta-xylosidase
MGSYRLQTIGNHRTVSAWVGSEDHKFTILMTNHAMPRHSIKTELVHFRLDNARRPLTAYVERIDDENANPHREWEEMGKPEYLSPLQIEQLEAASSLTKKIQPLTCSDNNIILELALPAHSVAAVTIEFGNQ